MKILVYVACIADSKARLTLTPDRQAVESPRILGPFDEAALELGLKLREVVQGSQLLCCIMGERGAEPLIRKVAAYRPDRLIRMDASSALAWDLRCFAGALAKVARRLDATLLLIGREFGDLDDGTLPPCLAEEQGWPFFGLCQALVNGGSPMLSRDSEDHEELMPVGDRLVASITNDKRNRLRHPLMKNVMAARAMPFEILELSEELAVAPGVIALVESERRQGFCRMFGGSVEAQGAALAQFFLTERGAP